MYRLDDYRIIIPSEGEMKTEAMIYASAVIRIENESVVQLRHAASLEHESKVLATPDIHVGFGVPIGCVYASQKYISPCAVGYDINCGMRLLTTPFNRDQIDVKGIANSIRREIPLGEGKKNLRLNHDNFIKVLNQGVKGFLSVRTSLERLYECTNNIELESDLMRIEEHGSLQSEIQGVSSRAFERGRDQLGTLGGGNHFIEIQEAVNIYDPRLATAFGVRQGQILIMIHSGSRGLGHQVGGDYMRSSLNYDQQNGLFLPAKDLSYFPIESEQGRAYLSAMRASANFAYANRQAMAMLVRRCVRYDYGKDTPLPTVYDVSHNIASFEEHEGKRFLIHRKGATRAFDAERMRDSQFQHTGQPVLIPGSMGTASYLLAGTASGRESFFSVNHGAGRIMSRTQALGKKGKHGAVSDEQFNESMKGVYLVCEDRKYIKEEAPDAYKDIDAIIETVCGAGLAIKVARMVPLAVLKG